MILIFLDLILLFMINSAEEEEKIKKVLGDIYDMNTFNYSDKQYQILGLRSYIIGVLIHFKRELNKLEVHKGKMYHELFEKCKI